MDLTECRIMFGKVMHGRLLPKRNFFTYGIYYLMLPISNIGSAAIALNRRGLLSFYSRDHGNRDSEDLGSWARHILSNYGINLDGEIILVCMPRVLGYVFNPVSFWLCYDSSKNLRAVLCEVNNTFGETHTYICIKPDKGIIEQSDTLRAEKLFHVSPFLEREGFYEFRFEHSQDHFRTTIDYFDVNGNKKLVTSLTGVTEPMTARTLRRAFWRYPLVTLKSIFLIHWQAVKLLFNRIRYIPKPLQKADKTSATSNLTKI